MKNKKALSGLYLKCTGKTVHQVKPISINQPWFRPKTDTIRTFMK
jgi:hypothetical protein